MARYGSDVLDLVRAGAAASRADVARVTGMSPSTASARVDGLVRRGLLVEQETVGEARAGRRPRRLSLAPGLGTVACIDLGVDHAVLHVDDLAGGARARLDVDVDIATGPETVLDRLVGPLGELLAGRPPLQAVCLGVPGPVGAGRDRVVAPARMPGWNGADAAALAQDRLGVPVVVENDANLIALGENGRRAEPHGDLVVASVDAGIGCGFIVGGHLYRGADGMAGDISHTAVAGGPDLPCSCGRSGCLDVVASGSALVAQLQRDGGRASTPAELVALAHDGDPLATRLLREAGQRVGNVLATVVSFLNPTDLVLTGPLADAPAFLSAVRSSVYDACLPATTASLEVSSIPDTAAATAHGGLSLAGEVAFERGAVAERARR
jgi:predicted NBD/HSP70 family sugar kinase